MLQHLVFLSLVVLLGTAALAKEAAVEKYRMPDGCTLEAKYQRKNQVYYRWTVENTCEATVFVKHNFTSVLNGERKISSELFKKGVSIVEGGPEPSAAFFVSAVYTAAKKNKKETKNKAASGRRGKLKLSYTLCDTTCNTFAYEAEIDVPSSRYVYGNSKGSFGEAVQTKQGIAHYKTIGTFDDAYFVYVAKGSAISKEKVDYITHRHKLAFDSEGNCIGFSVSWKSRSKAVSQSGTSKDLIGKNTKCSGQIVPP